MSCQIKRLNENFEQAQLRIMGLTTQVQALRHSTSSTGEGDADPTETECLCKTMFDNPWWPTICTNFSLFIICSLPEFTKWVCHGYDILYCTKWVRGFSLISVIEEIMKSVFEPSLISLAIRVFGTIHTSRQDFLNVDCKLQTSGLDITYILYCNGCRRDLRLWTCLGS